MQTVQLKCQDGVGILTLNNGVTNAIGPTMVSDLTGTIGAVANDAAIQGLVLASGNEKFFSIGLALPELVPFSRDEYREFHSAFNRVCLELYTLPKPVVAAISGHAIAGGCVLAMCCDYRYIASGRKLVGLNEVKLGVPVPYVADCVLRDMVGSRHARTLAEGGDFYSPEELQDIGVVDRVLPPEELLPQAVSKARSLGEMPHSAFAVIKQNRVQAVADQIQAHLAEREQRFIDCWFAADTRVRLTEALATFKR